MNELAAYLGGRGHEVTVITAKPGPAEVRHEKNYTVRMHRRMWFPALGRVGFIEAYSFAFTLLPRLLAGHFDVIQDCTFLGSLAAIVSRQFTGTPCIYWTNSLPIAFPYVRTISTGGKIHGPVMRGVDELIAISDFTRGCIAERYGRSPIVVPPAVDLEHFALTDHRDHSRPIITCAAALDDERKGGVLLMRAFNKVKQQRPECRLEVSSRSSPELRAHLLQLLDPEYRDDVSFMAEEDLKKVPQAFGRAAISVLPSVSEWFGMVVLESMATGTPVVGTRSGALPEIISNPGVGRLFEPGEIVNGQATNVDGLTCAILEALDLSQAPQTARNCRARAEQFSWAAIGPKFEEVYFRLAEKKAAAGPRR